MITEKVVLVLGAGASVPFGFPAGKALKDLIESKLNEGEGTRQLFRQCGFSQDEINAFTVTLGESGQSSIDAFLERRTELWNIGKTAIAVALLPCETRSSLFVGWRKLRHENRGNPEFQDNWYDLLFGMLTEDAVKWQDLEDNQLGIITFNYDRSLEQYLFTAFRNSYGIGEIDARAAVSFIPVEHVHGSLGPLPWQVKTGEGTKMVPYQTTISPEYIGPASESIVILPEGDQHPKQFEGARLLLREARYIYFLGFGYHPTNLTRLGFNSQDVPKLSASSIGGTALRLSAWAETYLERFPCLVNLRRTQHKNLFPETVYSFLHSHFTGRKWRP